MVKVGDPLDRTAEVLFCNEQFYNAFATGDFEAIENLWAQDVAVCCIHPGHPPLFYREDILASWGLILKGKSAEGIQCKAPEAIVYGNTAMVICYEYLHQSYLLATNLYIFQQGTWKMIHHHASPTSGRPSEEEEEGEDLLDSLTN